VTLDGSGSFDPDSDALTYAWAQTAGPSVALTGAAASKATFTVPIVSGSAVFTFQLVVNDGSANSAPATVNITVNHANRAPVANAGPNQLVNERTQATLDGSASSDLDGDTLSYLWTQVAGAPVGLTGATTAKPAFTTPTLATANDTFTFQLIVTDGIAQSAPATVSVAVSHVNRAPTATIIGPSAAAEGQAALLDPSARFYPSGEASTLA